MDDSCLDIDSGDAMIYGLLVFFIVFVVFYALCFWLIDRNAERQFSAIATSEANRLIVAEKRKREGFYND